MIIDEPLDHLLILVLQLLRSRAGLEVLLEVLLFLTTLEHVQPGWSATQVLAKAVSSIVSLMKMALLGQVAMAVPARTL